MSLRRVKCCRVSQRVVEASIASLVHDLVDLPTLHYAVQAVVLSHGHHLEWKERHRGDEKVERKIMLELSWCPQGGSSVAMQPRAKREAKPAPFPKPS